MIISKNINQVKIKNFRKIKNVSFYLSKKINSRKKHAENGNSMKNNENNNKIFLKDNEKQEY